MLPLSANKPFVLTLLPCVLPQLNNAGSTSKILVRHRMHVLFYSTLTIPKLQRSDGGLYTCRVTSGDQSKQEQVTVTIYGECFLLKMSEAQSALSASFSILFNYFYSRNAFGSIDSKSLDANNNYIIIFLILLNCAHSSLQF